MKQKTMGAMIFRISLTIALTLTAFFVLKKDNTNELKK
jgi:hypothetical protein